MAQQVDPVQAQLVQDAQNVVPHELERIGSRPVAQPVPTLVDSQDPEVPGELRAYDVPGASVVAQPVQQHQRRSIRGTADMATSRTPSTVTCRRSLTPRGYPVHADP